MAKKEREREYFESVALHAEADKNGRLDVLLARTTWGEHEVMRLLHHRVVDLLHENRQLHLYAEDLDKRLTTLAPDIVSDFVADLIEECREAVKETETAEDAQDEESNEEETK